jgi:hypothetical protein
MRNLRLYIPVLILTVSVLSCGKDKELRSPSCQQLESAVNNLDVQQARQAIESYIANLPSQAYTQANLEKLVQVINGSVQSGNCNFAASIVCFDCIKTNPSQSEINITLSPTVRGVVDISYNSANKMVFQGLHQ